MPYLYEVSSVSGRPLHSADFDKFFDLQQSLHITLRFSIDGSDILEVGR